MAFHKLANVSAPLKGQNPQNREKRVSITSKEGHFKSKNPHFLVEPCRKLGIFWLKVSFSEVMGKWSFWPRNFFLRILTSVGGGRVLQWNLNRFKGERCVSTPCLLAPPFCWTKFPKNDAKFETEFPKLPFSGAKKEPKPKLLSPDIFWWGGGLSREGVGAKKFGMSLETQGIKFFWAGYPGILPGYPGSARKVWEKKFGFNFGPYLQKPFRDPFKDPSKTLLGSRGPVAGNESLDPKFKDFEGAFVGGIQRCDSNCNFQRRTKGEETQGRGKHTIKPLPKNGFGPPLVM